MFQTKEMKAEGQPKMTEGKCSKKLRNSSHDATMLWSITCYSYISCSEKSTEMIYCCKCLTYGMVIHILF